MCDVDEPNPFGSDSMIFDYVVVGGGSAGAVVAARLAEDGTSTVCLLEAGGRGDSALVRVPFLGVTMVTSHLNNWQFASVPQTELDGRVLYQPRGKCLGGSSAINAMVYVRGCASDFDDWARQGATGWSANEVLPFFIRAEKNQRGAGPFHGSDGPLQVADQRFPHPAARAFVAACQAEEIPENVDFNGVGQEGAGPFQVTQFWTRGQRGRRCSTQAAYLARVPQNLTILTGAHATRVALEGRRAVGMHFRKRGRDDLVLARRDVILCAGSFGSPQLLLLSGIGPADALARHGVDVVHDLAGVGKNLQDHLNFTVQCRSNDPTLPGLGARGAVHIATSAARWMWHGGGLIASPYAEAGAFLRSDPAVSRPDLQLQFVIAIDDDHGRRMHRGYGFSCHVSVARPHSRGEVGLNSRDPMAPPRIDPKYLSDPRDLTLLLKGVKRVRRIISGDALAPYRQAEIYPVNGYSDDALIDMIRRRAETSYHPVGTCRIGVDAAAVVDPQLRVHGIDGLRVADASVMPTIISGNTNAAAIMIGERCADFVRTSAGAPRVTVRPA